jgi:23S rRNA Um-2552 2''-O-methyltransferase (EC 2.1.1.-)
MTRRDEYYNRAKQEGLRARSAYKLRQLDERFGLLEPGQVVVDLGAAPGGWLQVAAAKVGSDGVVVGVDRQRMRPLEAPQVTLLRADLTESETVSEIASLAPGGTADVVLSDMAPNMSGQYELDHARSVYLAELALEVAEELLETGGSFVAKVFDGPDVAGFRARVDDAFAAETATRPAATRASSSEQYVIGQGYLTGPVTEGMRIEGEITAVGAEGDGILKIEGYTVFVPAAETGEQVTVEVETVQPRFAFARLIDDEG